MTLALEAAKRARDRGSNVQIARRALLEARTAFEAGNYGVATERADYVLGLFESGPAHPAMPANATSTGGPPESTDAESARIWIRQATGSIQEAKARGLNVHVAKAALKAADYQAAVRFANQAVQLCASAGLARR